MNNFSVSAMSVIQTQDLQSEICTKYTIRIIEHSISEVSFVIWVGTTAIREEIVQLYEMNKDNSKR